jgi:hypothetical protein
MYSGKVTKDLEFFWGGGAQDKEQWRVLIISVILISRPFFLGASHRPIHFDHINNIAEQCS